MTSEFPAPISSHTKVCRFCAETIKASAIKCRHCQSMLSEQDAAEELAVVALTPAKVQEFGVRIRADLQALGERGVQVASQAVGTDGMRSASIDLELINEQVDECSDALERINDGTYGQCVACLAPIALERLERLPSNDQCDRCEAVVEAELYPWRSKPATQAPTQVVPSGVTQDLSAVSPAAWYVFLVLENALSAPDVAEGILMSTAEVRRHLAQLRDLDLAVAGNNKPVIWSQRPGVPASVTTHAREQVVAARLGSMWMLCNSLPLPKHARPKIETTAQPTASSSPSRATVRLVDWRGLRRNVTKPVSCECQKCDRRWEVQPQLANRLAEQQGLGGRLRRGGTKVQNVGAQLSGNYGAETATGLRGDRYDHELAAVYMQFRCPSCGSLEILLGK